MFGAEQIANAGLDAILVAGAHPDKAVTANGVTRLRMPHVYWVLGFIGLSIALLCLVTPFFDTKRGLSFWIPMCLGMLAVFGIPGFMCVMYGLNHYILITEDKFYVKGPLKPMRSILWHEVQTGRYSSLERAMILTTSDGRRMRVSPFLRGGKLFWRLLSERGGRPVGDWGLPYAYWR